MFVKLGDELVIIHVQSLDNPEKESGSLTLLLFLAGMRFLKGITPALFANLFLSSGQTLGVFLREA